MREILFRGKAKDLGEWVYGNLKKCEFGSIFDKYYEYYISLLDGHNMDLGGWNDGEQLFEVIPETVGQFTGLVDKNGKKIFEGDIVKGRESFGDYIGYVEYGDYGFWSIIEKRWHSDFESLNIKTMEILGNIHDNAELIGGVEK